MAILPGKYDITLRRRSDFDLTFQIKDSNSSPVDITGWTAEVEIWNTKRTKKYVDFTVEYLDRAIGKFKIKLTDEQSQLVPNNSSYDVLMIDPVGLREYYVAGSVLVQEGYTA
tara:strand:- start:1767 stop:2105 length:339 start_codon:yes stop_codon:yes gene_type:complete